jgi:hypothetical protein
LTKPCNTTTSIHDESLVIIVHHSLPLAYHLEHILCAPCTRNHILTFLTSVISASHSLIMTSQKMTTASISLLLLFSNICQIAAQIVAILPTTPSSTFPACAFTCSNLNAAASYCTQTNVGGSQETVNSCFCQRTEVTPFYNGPTGVCDAFCTTEADRSSLQSWFQGYCAAAGFNIPDGAIVTTLITSTRTPTSMATGTSRSGSGTGSTSSSENEGWYGPKLGWLITLIAANFNVFQVCFSLEMGSDAHCTFHWPQRRRHFSSMSQTSTCTQSR